MTVFAMLGFLFHTYAIGARSGRGVWTVETIEGGATDQEEYVILRLVRR